MNKTALAVVAIVYAQRGETGPGFCVADKAKAKQDIGLPYVHVEPLFDPLHNDPRWLPLLRELNLAPEQLAEIELKVTLPLADKP